MAQSSDSDFLKWWHILVILGILTLGAWLFSFLTSGGEGAGTFLDCQRNAAANFRATYSRYPNGQEMKHITRHCVDSN